MDNKITESALEKTANVGNGSDLRKVKEQTKGKYVSMEINLKRNYNAISKNGDTLELSEAGRSMGVHAEVEHLTGI